MQEENRNNRVHAKGQSGKTTPTIESLLPIGRENAVTTENLIRMSGCGSARELQQHIAYEREHGAIICSGSGCGYWKPKDMQEVRQFVKTMDARAINIFKATKSARALLKANEGQQIAEK